MKWRIGCFLLLLLAAVDRHGWDCAGNRQARKNERSPGCTRRSAGSRLRHRLPDQADSRLPLACVAARGYALARRGHSRDVERIGRFLQVLEKRSQRRFRVDVALVPPAALGARDVPRIDDEAYDAILKCGAAEVVTIGGLLRDGDTRVFWSGGVRQQVVDLEVTQTGVIPILGPVVASRPHGFFARTTLSLSPDAGYGRLDIHVS